ASLSRQRDCCSFRKAHMGKALDPFPLISIAGPPRERGQRYGQMAADRIGHSARIYLVRMHRAVPSDDDIAALIRRLVPQVQGFDARYIDEMQGIAEGAGIPFEQVFVINARTELVSLAKRLGGQPDVDGCTGAVVLPQRSRNGRLIHAQNWDWLAECV